MVVLERFIWKYEVGYKKKGRKEERKTISIIDINGMSL
jgi:hypothetical protein